MCRRVAPTYSSLRTSCCVVLIATCLPRLTCVAGAQLLGAMGPPGGGRQPMSDRVLRHFHMLSFTEMSSETVWLLWPLLPRRVHMPRPGP